MVEEVNIGKRQYYVIKDREDPLVMYVTKQEYKDIVDRSNKIEMKKAMSGICPKCGGHMSWKKRALYGYYDRMGTEHIYSCDSCMYVADSDIDI